MHCLLFFLAFLSLSKSSESSQNITETNTNPHIVTSDNTSKPKSTPAISSSTKPAIQTSLSMKSTQSTKPDSKPQDCVSNFENMIDFNNKKEVLLWCIIFFLVPVCLFLLIMTLTLICKRNNAVITPTAQRTAHQTNHTTFESIDGEPFETVVMTNYSQQEAGNKTKVMTPQEVENTPEMEKADDAIPTTPEENGYPVPDAALLPEPEPSEQMELMNEESTAA